MVGLRAHQERPRLLGEIGELATYSHAEDADRLVADPPTVPTAHGFMIEPVVQRPVVAVERLRVACVAHTVGR